MSEHYLSSLAIALPVFLLAGFVKGVTGMGLPTIAMGLLGQAMAPSQAAALIVVPSLLTNAWQFASGRHRRAVLRRFWPMMAAIGPGTWAGLGMLTGAEARLAPALLGVVLVFYAGIGLTRARLMVAPGRESRLAPLAGMLTGLATGATGVSVIPAAPFLQALGLDKDELIQALGLSFTVSALALAGGLAARGVLQPAAAGISFLALAPAILGMAAGQAVRARLHAEVFRTCFLSGLLALGAHLALRPFW